MGHKAEINGTGYDIKAGKCLVGGTAYAIKKGRTLVNGTGYDVKLGGSLTWLLNDYIGDSPLSVTDAGFISNDTHFAWLFAKYQMGSAYIIYSTGHAMSDKQVVVYVNRAWQEQAYRTLTFDEEPTGDLLTWLEANGTRQ